MNARPRSKFEVNWWAGVGRYTVELCYMNVDLKSLKLKSIISEFQDYFFRLILFFKGANGIWYVHLVHSTFYTIFIYLCL